MKNIKQPTELSPIPNVLSMVQNAKTAHFLKRPASIIWRAWTWMREQQASKSDSSRLRLEHSISLGQKRFAAVIEIQGVRFLIGGGASNVALLAKLDRADAFENVLNRTSGASRTRKSQTKRKSVAKKSGKADRTA